MGRFISQDPIGVGGGDVNLYRYVGNSASNATDPSGLFVGDWIEKEYQQLKSMVVEDLKRPLWKRAVDFQTSGLFKIAEPLVRSGGALMNHYQRQHSNLVAGNFSGIASYSSDLRADI